MPGLVKEHPEASTGARRKALSIGIQYRDAVQYSKRDPPPQLDSTHGDPEVVKRMLTQFYEYKEEDIVIMKDDGKHVLPTRENILKAIDDLVRDATAGDRFVFHFSGHGAQVPDKNGDEVDDGLDEVIWPVDIVYDEETEEGIANYILDDELKERLVDSLPDGTYLTIILDCCHSGSGVDLPHSRPESEDEEELHKLWSPISPKGRSIPPFSLASEATTGKGKSRGSFQLKLPHSMGKSQVLEELKSFGDFVANEVEDARSKPSLNKHVTSWAGCVDKSLELESSDGGMLTMAFWHVLRQNRSRTHLELYKAIAEHLVLTARSSKKEVMDIISGFPKPVLSSLQKLDAIYPVPFSF